MPFTLKDRVKDTTTTTGTGAITLSGSPPTGFQAFSAIGNGNECAYTIVGGGQWETGIGTYSSSGPSLSRDTVLDGSSGPGTPVNFSAGSKDVFVTVPAGLIGWQEIAAITPGSVQYINFTSIPQTFSDLRFVFEGVSHNNGSTTQLQLWVSPDGSTWSSAATILTGPTVSAANAFYGSCEIPGYRANAGKILTGLNPMSNSLGLTAGNPVSTLTWVCPGGIKALSVGWAAGQYDAGTIRLMGR